MSRRHSAEKREVIPDPKFGDIVVTKFMNSVMYEGKKSTAERIVYGAFDIIEAKTKASRSVSSRPRSRTSPRRSRFVRVASAVPPTRSRSRSAPSAARLSRSAG